MIYPSARTGPDAMLIALGLEGTLVPDGGVDVPPLTADAVQDVIAYGHHVVVTTRRALTGVLPVMASLQMTRGFLVCSGGSVTAKLTPRAPGGYEIDDARPFDVAPVMGLVRALMAETEVAVEAVGWGHFVTRPFEAGLLPGRQDVVGHDELPGATPRMILRAPGVVDGLAKHVSELGLIATPVTESWLEVTAPLVSDATALRRIQRGLGIAPENTIAVGSAVRDLEMLRWARTAIAMRHAPTVVRTAATGTTGTLEQRGAALILEGVLARSRFAATTSVNNR